MKIKTYLLVAVMTAFTTVVSASEPASTKIKRAMSAAPTSISQNALIIDTDGTVLKQGNNGWTCLPDTMAGDKAPMCNDETWMKMMQAVGKQAPFKADRIGISYMLQGEPTGSGVSNSTPYHHDHKNAEDYVETGPHIMIVVPKKLLNGLTTNPGDGGPYVMWGDTDYAHIMVPVALEGKSVITK
ncbi:hypothetical protein HII17_03765 [Thalassotalea sp. M1531]|uniref:Uncharacterized protein n=1 Tax=Thalassotalea algicola TaxID=2716224 RepID=A0A7Y0LA59_9GAMM|nr:hypothetical protein [Thalassotalea algicola]NMP30671.1 hypothetical protein [Thalassotalea algicola]